MRGVEWAYLVPGEIKNKAIIESLISCESGGVNISRPDNDGIISDGILQFHRDPTDTLENGTWKFFDAQSHIGGSPINSPDAIRQADWAISHGYLKRWSCARIMGLLK